MSKRLTYLGRANDFVQQTPDAMGQTPLFPEVDVKFRKSPANQDLIMKDLREFVVTSPDKPESAELNSAIRRTTELFRLPKPVKIIHLNDVFQQDLDIWSQSSGIPWVHYGYKTKGDIRNDPKAVKRVRSFAHSIKYVGDIKFPDCLVYEGSHLCEKGEYKVQTVWEYPTTVTFIEIMFALPLIKAYQNNKPDDSRPIAYGFETAMDGIQKIRKRFRGEGKYISVDFKKFDKTVPPWLIDVAFDIMFLNLDFLHYEQYGVPDAKRIVLLYDALKRYFVKTKFRTPNGNRYKKYGGIPSGSYFSQLVATIVNTIILNWLSLEQFGSFPEELLVLGDDSLMRSSKYWNFKLCNRILSHIGMEINVKKSEQSKNLNQLKFLGYRIGNDKPEKDHSTVFSNNDVDFSNLLNKALRLYYANMYVSI